jgi:hypothetical protein
MSTTWWSGARPGNFAQAPHYGRYTVDFLAEHAQFLMNADSFR